VFQLKKFARSLLTKVHTNASPKLLRLLLQPVAVALVALLLLAVAVQQLLQHVADVAIAAAIAAVVATIIAAVIRTAVVVAMLVVAELLSPATAVLQLPSPVKFGFQSSSQRTSLAQ
jgi:hypothetical protein